MRIPRYIEHVIYTTFYIASLPAVKSFLSPTNTIPGFLAGPAYKKHHGDPRPSDCDITHSTTSLLHMDHMNHTLKYSPISFFSFGTRPTRMDLEQQRQFANYTHEE